MKRRSNHDGKSGKNKQNESRGKKNDKSQVNANDNNKSEKTDNDSVILNDDVENQGFGDWLRSSDGLEMMRLFVIANSVLIFVTMAVPKIQEAITFVKEYYNGHVLYWYSTTIWKMIDGYFRDQFKSYLEEEYKKNPKMKSDVQVEGDKMKSKSIIAESPSDSHNLSNSSVITDEMNETEAGGEINESGKGDETLKEAADSLDAAGRSELKTNGKEDEDREDDDNNVVANDDKSNDIPQKTEEDLELESSKSNKMKYRNNKVVKNSKEAFSKNRLSKRGKSVRLNEKGHVSSDQDDFWEFEEDAVEKKESREGILISELPFKPKLDLGDLERVTKDEYCPLSLEDEEPCEKLYKWP